MIQSLYESFRHWSAEGAVYIISDPHFNDPDCQIMDRHWPMPEDAIKSINASITKNDTLVILGDVGDERFVSFLNAGRKVLVSGNHDKGASKYKRKIRTMVFDDERYTYDDAKAEATNSFPLCNISISQGTNFLHPPFTYYIATIDNGLFDEIYTGPLMIGEKLLLSHEPISLPFVTNIHGHVHGGQMRYKNEFGCNCINVATDVCRSIPINLGVEIKNGLLADTPSIHRLEIDKRM